MDSYYTVTCPELPALNGKYYYDPQRKVHVHEDGFFYIARYQNTEWGVADDHYFLLLSHDKPESPNQVQQWNYLDGQKYVRSPRTKVLVAHFDPKATNQQLVSQKSQGGVQKAPYVDAAKDWTWKVDSRGYATYTNRVTHEMTKTAPTSLCNVGQHIISVDGMKLILSAPLSEQEDSNMAITKRYHATIWQHTEELWSPTMESLEKKLSELQSSLQAQHTSTQSLRDEMQTHQDTLNRTQAELRQFEVKEAVTHQRSSTMASRLGRVHIKRDEKRDDPAALFPTGDEIRAKYAEVFGDSFEEVAGYAVSYIEDTFRVKDGTEIFIYEVMVPLFRTTRAFALRLVQDKFNKLAEAFGLPAWSEQQMDEDGDNIAVHFFLTSQQEPLLKAAAGISETAVREIVKLMGAKAESVRAGLPAWATRNQCAVLFDLPQLVRTLVWVNTAIELSDPKCYLHPPVAYAYKHIDDKNYYKEVFSPGTKMHGLLKADSEVQVAVPGLYFECPTEVAPPSVSLSMSGDPQATPQGVNTSTALPVVPVRVRRLQAASFREISVTASADREEAEVEGLSEEMKKVVEIDHRPDPTLACK